MRGVSDSGLVIVGASTVSRVGQGRMPAQGCAGPTTQPPTPHRTSAPHQQGARGGWGVGVRALGGVFAQMQYISNSLDLSLPLDPPPSLSRSNDRRSGHNLGWRQPTRLCGAGLAAASTKRFNVFYLETKTVQGRPSKKPERHHASRSRCAEEPEEAAAGAAWFSRTSPFAAPLVKARKESQTRDS